jgi:photosystem II stability/assembly factor-like uncharacterized protein
MPKLTADEVVTQQHKRAYLQWGGPKPNNPVTFAGQDGQYMTITGVSSPESGGFDPIWAADPSNAKRYKLIGRKATTPSMPGATMTFFEKHGILPRQLFQHCPFSAYEVTGTCQDLSDLYNGVTDYLLVYSLGLVTDKNLGDRVTMDTDEAIGDELTVTLSEVYPVGPLGFGNNALTLIDREVIDVVYGNRSICGDCGKENDGSDWIYAVTRSSGGSPGLPAEVIYSTDGGITWSQVTVTGIGAAEDPAALDFVGSKLVVLSPTAGGATSGGYYWADIDPDTGAPGTWTKVTSGFVATAMPSDMFVLSPREIFFSGALGYIYKSTDITSGVSAINAGVTTISNLARIDGTENAIVSVGASGVVIVSSNRGATFASTVAAPTTSGLTALEVFSAKHIWTGSVNGYMWFTLDGGKTWTKKAFSGEGTGQVFDILFATNEIGYMLNANATPTARLFITLDGGMTWTNSTWRIFNWPVFNYAKRAAVPTSSDPAVNANNIVIGGITSTNDGVLLLGVAERL